jgi:crotonobetainyl-CoA:carnitine CoA-transferase CaiB-like acyl-CoA transferase
MAPGALSGLTVLELAEGVSGAYCGKLLAGLGADVTKIERPARGARLRKAGPFPNDRPHIETGALHLHLDSGKRSLTLDLHSPTGRRLLRRLTAKADVLISSITVAALESLGLDHERLSAENDPLVLTTVTPRGASGPRSTTHATEIVIYALGGYLMLTGDPDKEPLKAYGHQGEYQAGLQAAAGTLVALTARDHAGFGRGQHVDVAATEAVAFLLGGPPLDYYFFGREWRRNGTRLSGFPDNYLYPSTIRPCKDGYVHVHGHNRFPELLATLMHEPRLAEPDLLAAMFGHADEIDAIMDRWLAMRTRAEAVEQAQELRLPFAAVLDPSEAVEDAAGVHAAREFFVEIEHPVAGRAKQPGPPIRFADSPWETRPAPLLGEHNEEIYCGMLGLSRRELVRLRQAGVV